MFAAPLLRNAPSSSSSAATASAFSQAHKSYVKSLYRRYLKNSLDWCIRRDVWRDRAIEIRVEFERHRNVRNPRELANLFEKAERELKRIQHPDPHRRKSQLKVQNKTSFKRNGVSARKHLVHKLTLDSSSSSFSACFVINHSCNVRGRHKVGAQPATSYVLRGREESRTRGATPLNHTVSQSMHRFIQPHSTSCRAIWNGIEIQAFMFEISAIACGLRGLTFKGYRRSSLHGHDSRKASRGSDHNIASEAFSPGFGRTSTAVTQSQARSVWPLNVERTHLRTHSFEKGKNIRNRMNCRREML